MKMQVFGLMHLDEKQKTAMNVPIRSFQDQVSVYLNNAVVLSKTLQSQGISFSLFTNNKAFLQECASAGHALNMIEIPFATKVPNGARFYSAHFKIDVFRYFASLKDGYFALCDLDMVCINDRPPCLDNIIEAGIPLCYDISDHVIPSQGYDTIMRDLEAVNGLKSEGRWTSGGWISGTPEFFQNLVRVIDEIYDRYVANISSQHHVGDEAVTSPALEILRRQGVYVADAGPLGIIGTYWNSAVTHPQKPFDYFINHCFILHLPADKRFISDLAERDAESLSDFKKLYARYRIFSLKMLKIKARILLRYLQHLAPKKGPITGS